MQTHSFCITLCWLIASFSCLNLVATTCPAFGENGVHFCGFTEWQPDNRRYARSLANLDVGESRTVRLIYFLPNDRASQKDIDAKMARLIKDVQQSYAEVMENHGFGSKTFRFETDSDGKTVVSHVNGRFPDAYYHTGTSDKVREEMYGRFDPRKNIYLVVLDVSNGVIDGYCGQAAADGPDGGVALIPAPNRRLQRERGWSCFNVAVAAHELGHCFGLAHDRLRNANRRPSSYHADQMTTSYCAVEWLDVHRYFNIGRTYPERDNRTTVQMSPLLASSPNAIRLRFEITDTDGLRQAQLFWIGNVIACQQLNGQSDEYEFALIPTLHGNPKDISLRVIDAHGNFTVQWYSIDITALLPPPKVVSIADTNLAAAIREVLNLTASDAFTQWNLAELINLDVAERQITDLSGLEHATQLQGLALKGNKISDISALASLKILESLTLPRNQISDIKPLAGLTRLSTLDLGDNQISDISPLSGLTHLSGLWIGHNQISDIKPLEGLTRMSTLDLGGNQISNLAPLAELTGLDSLWLWFNHISDLSPLARLRNLKRLFLNGNSISDISPLVDNTALGSGNEIRLHGNPLSYLSIHTHIPALQERGVLVTFDSRTPRRIRIISGSDQVGGPGTVLANPFIVEVWDENNTVYEGVPVTFTVTNGGGTLSAGTATTDANGRARSTLTLGSNPGTNSVTVSVTEIQMEQAFSAEGIRIPKTLQIVSGDDQQGQPGTALGKAFVVEVTDQSDNPLPKVQVTFTVSSGGGSLSATSVTTDRSGRAESILTLGPNAGTNSVTVSVTGIQEMQTFSAEGIQIPATLAIFSGDEQEGLPGTALQNPFVVEVTDQFDNALPGVQVTFTVSSGGGTLSTTGVTTNSNGRAQSLLILGPNTGTNTVTVSVTGIQERQTFTAEGIEIPKAFWIISGDSQQGLLGEALAKPFVVEVRDQSGEPMQGVQVTFLVTSGGGTLNVMTAATDKNGRAESILTLGLNPGTNTVEVEVKGIQEKQTVSATAESPRIPQDVNGDNVVNILDLVLVASVLGEAGQDLNADVNGDGFVNILDLVLIAGALGNAAAAPSMNAQALKTLSASEAGRWLAQAGELDLTDPASREGVLYLEQLLAALTPNATALLPNYPNPINPETWIPYQLAEDANVMLTIYDSSGIVVRRLKLGHRFAGHYTDRSSAVYWNGRNGIGEAVSSGVYFYHLSAGDYSATRKMLILK